MKKLLCLLSVVVTVGVAQNNRAGVPRSRDFGFASTNPLPTSAEIRKSVYFSEKELSFETVKGYQVPRLKLCNFIPNSGEPQLPVKAIYFLLPEGTRVKKVFVGARSTVPLQGEYNIYPSQPPQILKIPNLKSQIPKFVEPKAEVYELEEEYPGKLIEFVGEGFMRGYRIAEVLVYPLQWVPKIKELKLYTEIEICVKLTQDTRYKRQDTRDTPLQVRKLIKEIVINPEDVVGTRHDVSLPPEGYEYVIITSAGFVSGFEPLREWKMRKGVPCVIRTTGWINTNYIGRDLQEKIRNYLKVAAQDSGLVWVLLGGDDAIVPSRVAYAMTCEAGFAPDEDSLHADLYYSDLDGSWDANNNNTFGEVDDGVDLYPDVFVGRAPVSNVSQAQAFVNKIIKYERNPPTSYLTDALFFAEILWSNPYTDAGVGKDMIGELFPAYFDTLKLYESRGNENWTTVMNALNNGKALLNHDGHAWYSLMGIGPDCLQISDMDALTNGDKQGILYSIGCWPAAFDYDCIAEHWVRNSNGGGVAFIGNSRYGWGSPGNPGYGYSDKLDEHFYYNLFKGDVTHIGATLAKTKLDFIAYSRNKNVWRWHQYQVNLLGEPEMDIWTDSPGNLEVSHPDSVSLGESKFKVSVGLPIEGIRVCCEKAGEVYEYGYTDEAGEIIFNIEPATLGSLQVTVSYHNYFPYQGIAKVYSGAYPGYYSHTIVDSSGNGEINPNEPIELWVTLKNYGSQPANGVIANLMTTDPYVTLLDSTGDFGNIPPAGVAQSDFGFRVANAPNGHLIQFTLELPPFGHIGLNFQVKTPWLSYQYYAVDHKPEPGDTFDCWIVIQNKGGEAPGVEGEISSSDPYLLILDTLGEFGDLKPHFYGSCPYRIAINPSCPSRHSGKVILNLTSLDYSFQDTFFLSVGQVVTSFSDDFESGAPGWTHGGTSDLWTLTDHNFNSPTYSWYCGNTGTWQYQNYMDCWLLSPQFILGPNSWLSFWSWFDVATYSASGYEGDGIYPIIKRGAFEDTLDFIGCGGALKSFIVDWAKYSYALSSYPVGCTLQVKFAFISDNEDVAEGFYIDDIRIGEFETPPEFRVGRITIEDSLGNNDGMVDPGESVYVYIWLINEGTNALFSASGSLSCADPYVTILPYDSLDFGDIFGRRVVDGYFSFVTDILTPVGHYIEFNLNVDGHYIQIGIIVGGAGAEEVETHHGVSLQIYPNPFTLARGGIISYQIPGTGYFPQSADEAGIPVSLKIYDITGRIVKTLVDKLILPGQYKATWDARGFPSGIYFVRLEIPGCAFTKKLILIR